jgi:hypothetical protein
MRNMFEDASAFTNQDLGSWNVAKARGHCDFMTNSGTGNTEPTWK